MIIDEFYLAVEAYKRGMYDKIVFYDYYQDSLFRLHKQQIQALEYFNDDETTSVGYGGAGRGGKSALISLAGLLEAYAYPGSRYLYGRLDLQLFYGTTFKTLERIMNNFGFTSSDYHHSKGSNQINFFGPKSEFIFRNLQLKPKDKDASSFGSLEITKAFIDQSENINLKIIDKINERVGTHANEKYNIKGHTLECFNPLKTHVHKRYWQMYKQGIENPSIKFVRALATHNPSPEAQRWIREKENDYRNGIMTEKEYQKQVLGNFDYADDASQVIPYQAMQNYFNGSHIKGTGEYFMTIDPARLGDDKTVIRIWNGWKCVASYRMFKADAPEVVKKVKELQAKYVIVNSNTVMDVNGLGGGMVGFINCEEFVNNGRPIPLEDEEEANYDNLKSQCSILMGRKIAAGEVVEVCHDKHVELQTMEEMEQVRIKDLDSDGKEGIIPKKEVKQNIQRSPDEWDSIMMRYYFELRETFWAA